MNGQSAAQGNRWFVTQVIFVALVAMIGIVMLYVPGRAEAIRSVVHATARASLVLFLLTFCASGLARLTGAGFARWLLRNRRQIGVSFALSHLLHGAAVIAFARQDPVLFDALTSPASFIFGGAAYGVIIAMLVTSFDGPARAIGPQAWQRLHTFGIWFLWLMFVINFGKRVPAHPSYIIAVLLAFAALAVRLIGRGGTPRAACPDGLHIG
ncbi:MAG: ferric reductase-like transmembrane domain-containing protein [Proteobacteria bacterium]|nr:ferric reductase-like transmembrane domain-containing protein [Pseudomonadota bacterium]